jgi:hypothetical protein
MPIISSRVSVTGTATVLSDPTRGSIGDPIGVVVKNTGGTSIYLGGSGVTSAAGLELAPGETLNIELMGGDVLYGITASGTVIVSIMKLRQ